jgi:integrase
MPYQRGSLKAVPRKGGDTWVLRYRVNTADGKRVEHGISVGLLRDFPTEKTAWREVDRLGLLVRINLDEAFPGRIRFDALAEFYLKADFGEDAIRPKSVNTIPIVEHYVRDYLVSRWGDELAGDMKPLEIQKWFKSLHTQQGLAWTTVSKMRGIMNRIFVVGLLHEKVDKNPVELVETRSKSTYKAIVITPKQTLDILNQLTNPLHFTLVLTCAATALRSSEILSLRWDDILWEEGQIRISKRWAKGEDGETKTESSNGHVPMHPALAQHLKDWRSITPHGRDTDFVFPSLRTFGKVPLSSSIFVQDHLRPAAKSAGVMIAKGQRFGLHNLRHSLSTWLVNQGKVAPKTVQGILRHADIRTTMNLYTQDDRDEKQAAQGAFLSAVGLGSRLVQ